MCRDTTVDSHPRPHLSSGVGGLRGLPPLPLASSPPGRWVWSRWREGRRGNSPLPPSRQPRGNAAAQTKLAGGVTDPYSSVYGKASSKDPNFQVDRGQLTFDAEGTEGGRFHSRMAHVPPGPSLEDLQAAEHAGKKGRGGE